VGRFDAVSVEPHVVLGGGELRLGRLQILERGCLAVIEIARRFPAIRAMPSWDCALFLAVCAAMNRFAAAACSGCRFPARVAALDLDRRPGDQTGYPARNVSERPCWRSSLYAI